MSSRTTQANKEIASSGQITDLRVTQSSAEVLDTGDGSQPLRVTQAPLEILDTGDGSQPLLVTQAPLEVLDTGDGNQPLFLTQSSAEVLVWVSSILIWMEPPESVPEGDVPNPTVILSPPPPPPVFYYYPSGGGKVMKWKPEASEDDKLLRQLEQRWKSYVESMSDQDAGLKGLGRISNGIRWLVLGNQRRQFFRQGSIITPAPADGDVAVVDFTVPEGYFGFLSGFWWAYTGSGYLEGSNDIHWRIKVGDWQPDGYGDVQYQLGTPTDPLTVTGVMPLRSRQRVRLMVFVKNDSGLIQVGASRILGGLVGWFYEPEKIPGRKEIRW